MSDAGHVAWLAFALCRRRVDQDVDHDDAIVHDFKLLLVVTTELLVPNAPAGYAKDAYEQAHSTQYTHLQRLADKHEVPFADLQTLVAPVRAVLNDVLGDVLGDDAPNFDKPLVYAGFCEASGAIAPWVAARLSNAHAAAVASQGGVDEAVVWQEHAATLAVEVDDEAGKGNRNGRRSAKGNVRNSSRSNGKHAAQILSPPSALQRLSVSSPTR